MPIANRGQDMIERIRHSGVGGQLALGAMLGVVWSPCAGPTLGAAVGLAAQSDTMLKATAVMAIFSLGAVTPILLLAYGSRQAIAARRELLARVSTIGKPITAGALIIVGIFILSGLDKSIEASLTGAMPDWLVRVTTNF